MKYEILSENKQKMSADKILWDNFYEISNPVFYQKTKNVWEFYEAC